MEQITSNSRSKEIASERQALVSLLQPVLFFDLDYYVELLAERRKRHKPTFSELIATFPQAKKLVKSNIMADITMLRKRVEEVNEDIAKNIKPCYQPGHFEVVRETFEKEMRRLNNKLLIMGGNGDKVNIGKAKQFPIDQLVKVTAGGKAHCVWHEERTASMHYYKDRNMVWCFGCQRGGDAIDVYCALNNVPFTMAVKQLQ